MSALDDVLGFVAAVGVILLVVSFVVGVGGLFYTTVTRFGPIIGPVVTAVVGLCLVALAIGVSKGEKWLRRRDV